jgi:hypothetical protein
VISFFRRFRGPLAIVTTLILSTSVAFAGEPASSAAGGLSKASTHAGRTVPVEATGDESGADADADADADTDAEADEDVDAEESEAADNCATDPTNFTPEELAAVTHGSVVCWAAQQPTPEGYANHGAWVSQWAKGDHGGGNASSNSHKGGNH